MKAIATAPMHVRGRLRRRMESVLSDLLEHEATAKATSYDKDRPSGYFEASAPAGVNLALLDGDVPPVWVSPYHHFRRRLELAEDESEFRRVLRAARRRADALDAPASETHAIGGTNWEEIEFAILEQGVGFTAVQMAAAFEVSADLIEQIREENDHDPATGFDNGPDKIAVRKAREMHLVDGMSVDQVANVLRKSRRTVYRYLAIDRDAA